MSGLTKGSGLTPTAGLSESGEGLTAPYGLTNVDAPVVTWSETNLAVGDIVLSNGDLTATVDSAGGSSNNVYGRSDSSIGSSSKAYYEVLVVQDAGSSTGVGVCNASQTFPGAVFYLGATANAISYYSADSVLTNNGSVATLASFTTGDVVSCAVDVAHAKVWWRVNGAGWNNDILANQNPATNTGGIDISGLGAAPLYPAYNLQYDGSNFGSITANFGATAFTYTPPSGFTAIP